jgi:hypothetical protein
MAVKPSWQDSKDPESPDGKLEMLSPILKIVERLTFYQAGDGTLTAEFFYHKGNGSHYDYVEADTLPTLIIKLQEKLL